MGKKGGKAGGACKVRGTSEYYRRIRAIRKKKEAARKRKAGRA